MDEEALATQVKRTNTLMLLAFGKQIASRIEEYTGRPAARAILIALAGSGEAGMTSGQLLAAVGDQVARTVFFATLMELQRAGLVERPRRGSVSLAPDVEAFLPAERPSAKSIPEKKSEVMS